MTLTFYRPLCLTSPQNYLLPHIKALPNLLSVHLLEEPYPHPTEVTIFLYNKVFILHWIMVYILIMRGHTGAIFSVVAVSSDNLLFSSSR